MHHARRMIEAGQIASIALEKPGEPVAADDEDVLDTRLASCAQTPAQNLARSLSWSQIPGRA